VHTANAACTAVSESAGALGIVNDAADRGGAQKEIVCFRDRQIMGASPSGRK
jgi:hypothetical protein